jgi:hypothetical protein
MLLFKVVEAAWQEEAENRLGHAHISSNSAHEYSERPEGDDNSETDTENAGGYSILLLAPRNLESGQ